MFPLSILIGKLAPAYVYVLAGYLAKRLTPIREKWIAHCLFYVFIPMTVFKGALSSDAGHFLILTGLALMTSCFLAVAGFYLRKKFDGRLAPGMVSCLFSYLNIGWFGIPIVQAVYGPEGAAIMTAFYVGGMLFGNTIGYSLATAGEGSWVKGLSKLIKIPSIYAVVIASGLKLGFVGSDHLILERAGFLLKFGTLMTSICGMGLVGMSIAYTQFRKVPWGMLGQLLAWRFACILLLTSSLQAILLPIGVITALDARIYLLFAALPIAANLLVFSAKDSKGQVEYELVGIALFASTVLSFVLLLAAIYLPHLFLS
ncbi:AEC family transporter [Undibacterium sp. RuRC25W]|uniref:AEC family transporter n=1 Tax=Undibacterium sp. RuRC25W TaxID=3413047 RepID=UPI003BF31811